MGKEGKKDIRSFGEIQFVTNLYLTFNKSTFSLAECSSNIRMFCFIFTFGILSLLLTLNFASVYMWLTSPHLVGLPCQSLTFCEKKCFLHLIRSKLELAIRFRIMRFHLCAYALWIRYSCPLMMVLDRARSAENIGLLKKMTNGSWRGPAAESATFSGTRFLHLRHKIHIEHLK